MVRVVNALRYDRLRLAYFEAARFRKEPNVINFPPFDKAIAIRMPIPSATYCREALIKIGRSMRPDMDQAMSLLPADILAGDGSFKVSLR